MVRLRCKDKKWGNEPGSFFPLGVRTMGTAGIVMLPKRKGLIASVEDALRQLQGSGLWLCEELIVALAAESDH